jgi:hypothetical protein
VVVVEVVVVGVAFVVTDTLVLAEESRYVVPLPIAVTATLYCVASAIDEYVDVVNVVEVPDETDLVPNNVAPAES